MNLADILKDSNYKLSQFTTAEIEQLEQTITLKATKSGEVPYMVCLVRQKAIKLTPEEAIRQLYLRVLIDRLHYPLDRIQVEYGVNFGREVKRADIVVMDKDRPNTVYMLVELKKPKLKDGKDQLRSYCNATGAPIAVWTNGDQISYYQRKDPNYFEDIPGLPNVNQTLADILQIKFTLEDLIANDKLVKENKSLKTLIEEMEDEVLANAGVDVFEELFKLIFTKLYDEWYSGQGNRRKTRSLEFRNTGQTEAALKSKIQDLFDGAKKKWEGVFSEDAKISLTPSHLSVCVSSLENVKLFNSNLDVIDEAFEYLINQSSKGDKGQYFTPRYVIDMCVKMLNPQEDEYMIDTAAGSSGFPVHTIFHVWRQILADEGLEASHLFSLEDKPPRCNEYVEEKVFAIDFDEKAVRVARTLNLIAGDGQTNVLHLNTLDYELWDEITKQDEWDEVYNAGFKRLKRRRPKGSKDYREFQFDLLMANPPFAGDIKEPRMISRYDLAKKPDGKWQTKVGRDILFIERNLDFLKPGGRMAIVLPQGRFNNSSDKNIRDFIAERCRILAVVGLHGNTFKPHTGTKTSVLFVQKWNDDPKMGALCPRRDDYNIFFATMQKSGKDNSGEKIYRRIVHQDEERLPEKEKERQFLLDPHDHLIVDHDLYNHEGLTEDGIAEAFIEFAKKENLSFFEPSPSVTPFDAERYQQLMDGLEAVELSLSYVLDENLPFRFDAEYFKKKYIELDKLLRSRKATYLSSCSKSIINFGAYSLCNQIEYLEKGVPYLNVADIGDNVINLEHVKLIDETLSKTVLHKSLVRDNQILLTIAGTIGNASVAYKMPKSTNSNQAIANITINAGVSSFYISTFLNSKIGRNQTQRLIISNVQPNLLLTQVKLIKVILPSDKFQKFIEQIIKFAYSKIEDSKKYYQQAEALLLAELGLQDWQPTEETVAVKSFAESFLACDRLDAEHYKLKYDELESKFSQFDMLKICQFINYPVSSGATPKAGGDDYTDEENGIPFIRAVDLKDGRVDRSNFIYIKRSIHDFTLKKTKVKKNDVLFSIAGTVGRCAIFDHEFEANINQAVSILRFEESQIKRLYLIVFFNSEIGKIYVAKYARQGLQTNLNLNEVSNLEIPVLGWNSQEKISRKVQESVDIKRKSKQLLEIAKTGVERAIETDEATAIAWINEQLEALNIKLT
jgi:type I restriction enzyme M protein